MKLFVPNKRWLVLLLSGFCLCFFLCMPVYAGSGDEDVDIAEITRKIKSLEEGYDYPDFDDIFTALRKLEFTKAAKGILEWLFGALTYEMSSSKILISELIGVVVFSGIFSNLASSFAQYAVSDSGFMITYFILFTILFSHFRIMASLFSKTIILLSNLIKIIIPAYTLAVGLSGNLTTGMVFYEYFMVLALFINWLLSRIVLPLTQYYLLLELLNHLSTKQNISRLCESLYLLLSRGMKLFFFLFFGFHLLETMVAPSVDMAKSTLLNRITGMIPGAGSVMQTLTGTVVGSSVLIKNTLGVTAIIFLLVILAIPIIKLLLYTLFYLLLSILLEPVSDPRFIRCILAAQKSGVLLIYSLCMADILFILTIAVTAMATNHV